MFQIPDDPDFDDEFLETEFSTDHLKTNRDRTLANVNNISSISTPPETLQNNVNPKSCSIASNPGKRSFVTVPQGENQKQITSTKKHTDCKQQADNCDSLPKIKNSHTNNTKLSGSPIGFHSLVDKTPQHSPFSSTSRQRSIPVSINSATQYNNLGTAQSTIESSSLSSSHSEFLAEWNDNDFFNPKPKEDTSKRLSTNSPTVPNNPRTAEAVTRKVNKTVRQRRFPGPAGLLPPRRGCTSLIAPEEFLDELKSEETGPPTEDTELLSQSSGSIFEGGAWSAMLDDLENSGKLLLKRMNLASIKAIGRNLRSYKVPFLAVLVQSVDESLPDVAVGFKDPTGEMHGVIHRDVWEQFGPDIAVGTVLVLRSVGIMSAGISSRQHVVNITGRNLTAIYSPKDELNVQLRQIHAFAAINSSKLLDEWEKVETQNSSASPIPPKLNKPPSYKSPFNNNLTSGIRPRLASPYNNTRQPCAGSSPSRNLRPQSFNSPTSHSNPGLRNSSISAGPQRSSSPFMPMQSRQTQPVAHLSSSFKQNPSQKSPSFAIKAPLTNRAAPGNGAQTNIPPAPNINSFQQRPSASPSSSQSTIPQKKPKVSQNVATVSSKPPGAGNPFQVHDSSIDSLLEGIDTDSLFGDF
ncbi:hypothetical protein GE061_011146 [Apolygus lucorum]|uniref:Homologous recombination OB-fold protein OB-fold domain-containing protein n=1 Tax=Apolygus lucorum TaxID=248454 RepID=A0A8S9XWZ3_APOLU|nr:hypothetical protein GE061_011146 [Apolygus lucorum]